MQVTTDHHQGENPATTITLRDGTHYATCYTRDADPQIHGLMISAPGGVMVHATDTVHLLVIDRKEPMSSVTTILLSCTPEQLLHEVQRAIALKAAKAAKVTA